MKTVYIIGAGPAGISAAINLIRYNYEVIVIHKQSDNFTSNDYISNYYGFAKPITTTELFNTGIKQAKAQGVKFIDDSIVNIKKDGPNYLLITANNTYLAQNLIIATGKIRARLKTSGFSEFRGKGIYLCADCDGYFYKNKPVAIIGYGKYLDSELKTLEKYSSDITIFTNDPAFTSSKYQIVTDEVIKFEGTTRLTTVITSKNQYPLKGVFIAFGYPGSLELATKLGIVVENNNILVDNNYQTNLPNVYAIGDVIGGKLQVAKAVYDGLMVAESFYYKDKNH